MFGCPHWVLLLEPKIPLQQQLLYSFTAVTIYLFIHLFISDKGPKSATDMPIKQCLTRYKIRQINTKNKRFKNRQTANLVWFNR